MIYEVTYKDENGNPLQQGTFNAEGPREALGIVLTTPSLAPPAGTVDIDIRRIGGALTAPTDPAVPVPPAA